MGFCGGLVCCVCGGLGLFFVFFDYPALYGVVVGFIGFAVALFVVV